jgi:hypothetical protein
MLVIIVFTLIVKKLQKRKVITLKTIRNNKIILIILLISLFFPITQITLAQTTKISQTNIGSIGSLLWAYNEHKERKRNSSIDLADSNSVEKLFSDSKTFNTSMHLITGIEYIDFFSERFVKFVKRDGENSSYKQEKGFGLKGTIGNKTNNIDNIFTAGADAFYRYDWAFLYILTFNKSKLGIQSLLGLSGGGFLGNYYSNNIYVGTGFNYPWFTTNVSTEVIQTHSVPIIDIFQQKYGEIDVPEINITYLFDVNETPNNLVDDQVILIERIIPKYQLIAVKTQNYSVTVNQSSITSATLQGSYNFTGQYSETNIGHEVLISDLNNFVFGWYGLENTTINYQQTGGFTIQGDLSWNVSRNITFTNGSLVSEDIRMPWWKSSKMKFTGLWSHKFADQGTLFGKGALQTVVEAIRTKSSTDTQEQLLIWANIIPSTMFGYVDLDNSGDSTVRLNGSLLEVIDEVMALGFVHGINLNQTYDYSNSVNAHTFWELGTDILNDKSENVVNQGTVNIVETLGVDPSTDEFSNMSVDFKWSNPVTTNGRTVFKWGIDYKDFPTTWSVTDGSTEILNHVEMMNIGYEYSLTIDPTNGEALLSNTYITSGISNSTIKDMVKDLSFATYKRDLYLGMQKAKDESDSTETTNKNTLETSFGTTSIIEHMFGGSKQKYTLDDLTTHDSQTTIVNVITGTGTSGEPESVNVSTYSPFASSKFARDVGMSLLKWSADERTKIPGIDWEFRENIVITAYPTWKGQGITHDPAYSAVYTPSKTSSESTISKTANSGTNSSSVSNKISGANWEIYSSILAISLLILVPKFKKNIKK